MGRAALNGHFVCSYQQTIRIKRRPPMIHKIPPPALPASYHPLCQPGHLSMTSPPNHGVLLMYLQHLPQ